MLADVVLARRNEVLEYGDWPDPRPSAGEVVVDIRDHFLVVSKPNLKRRP